MTGFVTDRFRRALDKLLALEGGYNDRAADHGGPTNFGISQRSYPTVNIRALTRAAAGEIYHRDYWCPLKCDNLPSEELAQAVFDFGVNAGIGTAAKALQRAVNALGRPLSVDGHIGRATLAAANAIHEDRLLAAFRRACRHHYEDIVAQHPDQQVWFAGWMKRIGEPQP